MSSHTTAIARLSCPSGREAANLILLQDSVRQVPLLVTTDYGPGILPSTAA
jgi:hypothetical protein